MAMADREPRAATEDPGTQAATEDSAKYVTLHNRIYINIGKNKIKIIRNNKE